MKHRGARTVHVVPDAAGLWKVRLARQKRVLRDLLTLQEAIRLAKYIAQAYFLRVVIHYPDGKFKYHLTGVSRPSTGRKFLGIRSKVVKRLRN